MSHTSPRIVVVDDAAALAMSAAEHVANAARRPISLCLAGGSTPQAAYERLAEMDLPWHNLTVFFGDERCVPPDAAGSNYRMAHEALLGRVPIPPEQVHRIRGELPPEDAARDAEADLRTSFPNGMPCMDLVLLGIGPDGHTASLFPGGPETDVEDRWCVPVHRPEMPQPWRVSMTLPVLNAAREVVFLASGIEKARMVARALQGDASIPAGRVSPTEGVATWIVTSDLADAAAV